MRIQLQFRLIFCRESRDYPHPGASWKYELIRSVGEEGPSNASQPPLPCKQNSCQLLRLYWLVVTGTMEFYDFPYIYILGMS